MRAERTRQMQRDTLFPIGWRKWIGGGASFRPQSLVGRVSLTAESNFWKLGNVA